MKTLLGVIIVVCVAVVCALAVLLNPGLGVLLLVVSVLSSVYALRSVSGRAARARRKRRPNKTVERE